jgi:uncharacterized protein YcaQ
MLSLSLSSARRLVLHTQLLDGCADLPAGKAGVLQVIQRLGYVQIDTISVIQRAHHHILWTRLPDYDFGHLDELLAQDRRIFEGWGHALSYLPIEEFPHFLPRMRQFYDPKDKWARNRIQRYAHLMPPLLESIRRLGPVQTQDIPIPEGILEHENDPDIPPPRAQVRSVLDILFLQGRIMVASRQNFQRFFDLTERVLPPEISTQPPSPAETARFFVRKALAALGIARPNEITAFTATGSNPDLILALNMMIAAGEVVPLDVDNDSPAPYYALPQLLEIIPSLPPVPPAVHLLSPFDNLVIQRDRLQRLFGFEYALECYVPPAKRQFGYFALPILWGDRLVGRLDPKTDRQTRTLHIQNLLFEPDFPDFPAFLPVFLAKLAAFARFNNCQRVAFARHPAGLSLDGFDLSPQEPTP